jgi:hypothetical protein
MKSVFGRDLNDVWHRAKATWPSRMNTLCGETYLMSTQFATDPRSIDPIRPKLCPVCEKVHATDRPSNPV